MMTVVPVSSSSLLVAPGAVVGAAVPALADADVAVAEAVLESSLMYLQGRVTTRGEQLGEIYVDCFRADGKNGHDIGLTA